MLHVVFDVMLTAIEHLTVIFISNLRTFSFDPRTALVPLFNRLQAYNKTLFQIYEYEYENIEHHVRSVVRVLRTANARCSVTSKYSCLYVYTHYELSDLHKTIHASLHLARSRGLQAKQRL